MTLLEFKDRLKYLREQKGWTKKDTAKKVGVTTGAYSNWEYGNREPNFETLKKIADTLETSIMYLLEGKLTSTDMEKAPKETVFDLYQMFEGSDNEIRENAVRNSLDFINNNNNYDNLEVWSINNLYKLLFTLRATENKNLSKKTKNFILVLLQNLNSEIQNNPNIDLDHFYKSTLEKTNYPSDI